MKNIMKSLMLIFTVIFPVFCLAVDANSNTLSFNATRVIYTENDKKGVNFDVTNKGHSAYLLQSRVLENNQSPNREIPFIVIPPLKRLEPEETLTLRIIYTGSDLPEDRESIFNLSLKSIPEKKTGLLSDNATISLATQNIIKLFYRPATLAYLNSEEIAGKLVFDHPDGGLKIKNPTPYWVSFHTLNVDKENIRMDKMISPFGQEQFSVNKKKPPYSLEWQIIGDNGYPSVVQKRGVK